MEDTEWVTIARKRLREKSDAAIKEATEKEAALTAKRETERLAADAAIRESYVHYNAKLEEIKAAVRILIPSLGLREIVWIEFNEQGATVSRMGPAPPPPIAHGLQQWIEEGDIYHHESTALPWGVPVLPNDVMKLCTQDLSSWSSQVGLESSVRKPYGKYMTRIDIPFTQCVIQPLSPDGWNPTFPSYVMGLRIGV